MIGPRDAKTTKIFGHYALAFQNGEVSIDDPETPCPQVAPGCSTVELCQLEAFTNVLGILIALLYSGVITSPQSPWKEIPAALHVVSPADLIDSYQRRPCLCPHTQFLTISQQHNFIRPHPQTKTNHKEWVGQTEGGFTDPGKDSTAEEGRPPGKSSVGRRCQEASLSVQSIPSPSQMARLPLPHFSFFNLSSPGWAPLSWETQIGSRENAVCL